MDTEKRLGKRLAATKVVLRHCFTGRLWRLGSENSLKENKVTAVVRETLSAYKRAHGSQAACHTDTLRRDISKI